MFKIPNKFITNNRVQLFPGPDLGDIDNITVAEYQGDKSIKCDIGNISIDKAKEICQILIKQQEPGITFDESLLEKKCIFGICTGASLEFAGTYLKIKKEILDKSPFTHLPYDKVALGIIFKLKQLKGKLGNSIEMRTKQLAFASIIENVSTATPDIDYSKNRFQSLAKYHQLKIDFVSNEINLGHIFSLEQFESYLQTLPQDSVFLIRLSKYIKNQKIDRCGHSMIYIQEGSYKIFYDPNTGAETLSKDAYCPILFNHFRKYLEVQQNGLRFYQLRN